MKGLPTAGGLFLLGLLGREAGLARLVMSPPRPADFQFWPLRLLLRGRY
jgi:hypothetical protein